MTSFPRRHKIMAITIRYTSHTPSKILPPTSRAHLIKMCFLHSSKLFNLDAFEVGIVIEDVGGTVISTHRFQTCILFSKTSDLLTLGLDSRQEHS